MTKKCLGCGFISDFEWNENPTNDYTCDRKNVPHEWVPLFWVRDMPGDRAATRRAMLTGSTPE